MYLKEYGSIHPTKHLTLLRCQNLSTPIFLEFKGEKEKKKPLYFSDVHRMVLPFPLWYIEEQMKNSKVLSSYEFISV